MVRTSKTSDTEQIESLWSICFGDSPQYIRSFLSTIGTPDRCLVIEKEKQIVSMLFMLPATMFISGKAKKITYIYACATLPKFRNCGLMKNLLDAAYQHAIEQSVVAQILIPASSELTEYYQKQGFQPFSHKPNFETSQLRTMNARPLTDENIGQIIELRKKTLVSDFVIQWPDDHMEFALKELQKDEALAQITNDSYSILTKENKILEESPFKFTESSTIEICSLIRFCTKIEEQPTNGYFNFGLD